VVEPNRGLSRRHFLAAGLEIVPLVRLGSQLAAGWTAEKEAALKKLVTSEMDKERIPGLSIAIVGENREMWSEGFGFADLEHRVPATPRTVYRIASVSKPITATAAMQLQEQRKLDLDAPVQRYVPQFPVKQWPITPRHLLEHTSGIRHYRPDEDVNRHAYRGLSEALEPFKHDPLLFEPGTNFRYTSYGFLLLGAVIEGAASMAYADCVRANLLQPCGMNSTRPDDWAPVVHDRARGYRLDSAGQLLNSAWVDQSNKLPGGGWLSTVEDLARFALAIQAGTLLRPTTRAQMWTRVKTTDGREMDYSKGWMTLKKDSSIVAAGHGGNQNGTTAVFSIDPTRNVATIILMNLESYSGIWNLTARIGQLI
jgi:CubicO group peptidase (beta-lactamase class C family)